MSSSVFTKTEDGDLTPTIVRVKKQTRETGGWMAFLWEIRKKNQGFSRCSTESRCGFPICRILRCCSMRIFVFWEPYGAVRCGSVKGRIVWCGAVLSKRENRMVRCGAVKNVKNRTAPYLRRSKVLDFKDPEVWSRFGAFLFLFFFLIVRFFERQNHTLRRT